MFAYRAEKGSFVAAVDMAAVSAFPESGSIFLEYLAVLNVFKKLEVSFFMFFFNFCYAVKHDSDLFKAFFSCCFCKFSVHFGPFVVFAFSRIDMFLSVDAIPP